MTVISWRARAAEALRRAGNPDADWDADALLMDALSCERWQLRLRGAETLPPERERALEERLTRRLSGEPLAYILGYTYFMGLRFSCDGRALIPRQDTETLAEEAIRLLKAFEAPRMLDLCCGTGCIGLSCARLSKGVELTLSDLSPEAMSLARENAQALGVPARCLLGDLFAPAEGMTFDLIACNPPYLTGEDMRDLQTAVRREPGMALYGGDDGLDFYRRLARQAGGHLAPGGSLLLEVGMGQAREVSSLLAENLCEIRVLDDLCGIERVVCARRPI